jgi:hypothetical protein
VALAELGIRFAHQVELIPSAVPAARLHGLVERQAFTLTTAGEAVAVVVPGAGLLFASLVLFKAHRAASVPHTHAIEERQRTRSIGVGVARRALFHRAVSRVVAESGVVQRGSRSPPPTQPAQLRQRQRIRSRHLLDGNFTGGGG